MMAERRALFDGASYPGARARAPASVIVKGIGKHGPCALLSSTACWCFRSLLAFLDALRRSDFAWSSSTVSAGTSPLLTSSGSSWSKGPSCGAPGSWSASSSSAAAAAAAADAAADAAGFFTRLGFEDDRFLEGVTTKTVKTCVSPPKP